MDTKNDVAQETAAEPAIETPVVDPVKTAVPSSIEPTAEVSERHEIKLPELAPSEPRLPDAATLDVVPESIAAKLEAALSAKPDPVPTIEPRVSPAAAREEPRVSPAPAREAPKTRSDGKVPPVIASAVNSRRENAEKIAGRTRGGRFALLAASIALAAGIGGAAGAAGFAAASKMMSSKPTPVPLQRADTADDIKADVKALRDALGQARAAIKTATDNIAALKANVDGAGKQTAGQLAKINDAVDRLERAQGEPAARLGKVIETLERLERRAAGMAGGQEITGAIPAPQGRPLGQPPQTLQQQQHQLQGPPTPQPTASDLKPIQPSIVDGWTLRRVFDGVAYIESRYGVVEVEIGDNIRGVGRVHEIKRLDGRWVVVTSRGLIVTR